MKKLILALSLLTLGAQAHEVHYHGGCCYRGGGIGWVAPALIGGVVGYELARPPVYVEQQPIIVQQPIVQAPPVGYHWQEMIDPQTGIKKVVAVPN